MKNIITIIVIFCCLSLQAINRYVATTGSNSNPGTISQPYLTITKGLSVSMAGDTLFVKAGTYPEYVKFIRSGTVGNPIVLKNYGNDIVIVDAQLIRVYCIYTNFNSNLVIDGFSVKDATNYNVYQNNGDNVLIKNVNSTLSISDDLGTRYCFLLISTEWSHNITIDNCTGYGGTNGLRVATKTDGVLVKGGEYSYNQHAGVSVGTESTLDNAPRNVVEDGVYCHHIFQFSGFGTNNCFNVTIRNCKSKFNAATGIQIERFSSNVIVEDCLCEDNSRSLNFETGIWIFNSDNAIVRRNICRGNSTGIRVSKMRGFQVYNNLLIGNNYTDTASVSQNTSGVDFSESTGTFYNNTLVGNSAANSKLGSIHVFVKSGTDTITSHIIIKNNIIMNDGSTITPKDMDLDQNDGSTVESDYNLIYNANRTVNIQVGSTNYTWEDYKTTSGQESHSVNTDPLFINPVDSDFMLQSSSPAINAGVGVGLATDYLEKPIIGLPDIGAYEFNSPPSVSITNPAHDTVIATPVDTLIIAATANDANGTIAKVDFYNGSTLLGSDSISPYSYAWINVPSGIYEIKAKATDDQRTSTISDSISITVFNTSSATINTSMDDVEEYASGEIYTYSTDIELVYDSYQSAGNQTVGLRFVNLAIPQNAIITNAYIQFTCDEITTGACNLLINGESADNSAPFNTIWYNVSARTKTLASINWSPPSWNTVNATTQDQRTPDISSVIQEIVNRRGYTSSSAISLIITGSGRRTAESYEGASAKAARLTIEYVFPQMLKSTYLNKLSILETPIVEIARQTGNLICYPIPFESQLHIQFIPIEGESISSIGIFNMTGNCVRNGIFNENKIEMNLSDLTTGIYIVNVKTNKGLYNKLVIKK